MQSLTVFLITWPKAKMVIAQIHVQFAVGTSNFIQFVVSASKRMAGEKLGKQSHATVSNASSSQPEPSFSNMFKYCAYNQKESNVLLSPTPWAIDPWPPRGVLPCLKSAGQRWEDSSSSTWSKVHPTHAAQGYVWKLLAKSVKHVLAHTDGVFNIFYLFLPKMEKFSHVVLRNWPRGV